MRAIILAAGRGTRLSESNMDGRPKCLIEIGGKSLLERQLASLFLCGVTGCDIVIGYEADRVVEHIATLGQRPEVAFHYNPRFEQGSVISLLTARDRLCGGEPVLLLDADVLFHPRVLDRLVQSEIENCFLIDREFETGEEPVKIAIRNGKMVEFRKQLDPALEYDLLGESVGFFRFGSECAQGIAVRCAQFDAEGLADAPHEEALRAELLEQPDRYGFEDVTGLPWIEIDFPEDVARAEQQILPSIPQ